MQVKIKPQTAHVNALDWHTSASPVGYAEAVSAMEGHVEAMLAGQADEKIWLLEHPALYTAGTSAAESELLTPTRFPVHRSGRGGRYTYHGPGQRIAYVMVDLRERGRDVRAYVQRLEEWVMRALEEFDVKAGPREGRVGLWVADGNREEKIAALGVRIRRWVTYHGVSININPDLSHFEGIVPCGISSYGVTSLQKLGMDVSAQELDAALKRAWGAVFG